MSVEHWNPAAEGPLSEQTLRRKLEARGYAVSRYVYPPGTRFPPHTHGIDKIDAVVSGLALPPGSSAAGGGHCPPRRFASSASHSAAPSVSTAVPGAMLELSSRCRSVSGSNTGHGGSPPRFGLPVAANCTQ